LPNVHELGGLGADDVHTEQPAALAVEDQLQEAGLVARIWPRAISRYWARPTS